MAQKSGGPATLASSTMNRAILRSRRREERLGKCPPCCARSAHVMARNSRVPTATRPRPAARYRAPTDPAVGDSRTSPTRRRSGAPRAGACGGASVPGTPNPTSGMSSRDGLEEHLLCHRGDDLALGITDHASQRPTPAGVDEALHILEQPFVYAGRTVEPGSVIEADH